MSIQTGDLLYDASSCMIGWVVKQTLEAQPEFNDDELDEAYLCEWSDGHRRVYYAWAILKMKDYLSMYIPHGTVNERI